MLITSSKAPNIVLQNPACQTGGVICACLPSHLSGCNTQLRVQTSDSARVLFFGCQHPFSGYHMFDPMGTRSKHFEYLQAVLSPSLLLDFLTQVFWLKEEELSRLTLVQTPLSLTGSTPY